MDYIKMLGNHRRAHLLLEATQKKLRARENLKVLSTESYRTDSRIRLDTGVHRRRIPFPFFAYPHYSQEGTNQPMTNLHTSMVLSLTAVQ